MACTILLEASSKDVFDHWKERLQTKELVVLSSSEYQNWQSDSDVSLCLWVCETVSPAELALFIQSHQKLWQNSVNVLLFSEDLAEPTRELLKDLGVHLFLSSAQDERANIECVRFLAVQHLKNQHLSEMLLLTRSLNDELEKLSHIDNLTGLPNRRRFEEVFHLEWRRATREKTSLAVCMIDVDHFKAYNDSLGHQAGDQCLQSVASCLHACFRRPGDIIARYGGEEFVGLLAHTDQRGARVVFEWLRKRVEDLRLPHPTRECVTISLGYSCLVPSERGDPEEVLKKADEALYQAKQDGRNRVRQYRVVEKARQMAQPFQLSRPS